MKRLIIIVIGGSIALLAILLAIGFLVVGPLISSAGNRAQDPTATPAVAATSTATTPKKNPVTAVLKANASAIQSQVAQQLHLSVAQLQSDLKSGQTLTQIATAQNISTTQLQTIVTSVVKPYLDQAVASGTLTQKQEDAALKRLQKNPDALDRILASKTA